MNTTAGQIHEVSTDAVFGLLRSRPDGLTAAEVAARLRQVGPNRLRPPSKLRWPRLLTKHFTNFFSILLDIAAAFCFAAEAIQPGEGLGVLGWALLGVSVLNALFAFAQEMRAERHANQATMRGAGRRKKRRPAKINRGGRRGRRATERAQRELRGRRGRRATERAQRKLRGRRGNGVRFVNAARPVE